MTTDQQDDNERNQLMAMMTAVAAKLGEHFGSVRIIATRENGGSTESFTVGSGNYFAQFGSAVEWVEKQNEQARLERQDEWDSGED
jgi:hypothetical protein